LEPPGRVKRVPAVFQSVEKSAVVDSRRQVLQPLEKAKETEGGLLGNRNVNGVKLLGIQERKHPGVARVLQQYEHEKR